VSLRRSLAALRGPALAAMLGPVLLASSLAGLAGCAEPPADGRGYWRGGQLTIGTGNTTGVFYQVGGGYADVISAYVNGYDATTAATGGSADNILRLTAGDVDIAFTFADVAADAVRGAGAFTNSPRPLLALAALYRNYTHLVVRADAGIRTIADLKGKRVSTGPVNSGTETLAVRIIEAAGLSVDRDIVRSKLSLSASTRGIQSGSLDAIFYSAGLPTTGIVELLAGARGEVRFLSLDGLLPALEDRYPGTYRSATIPQSVYKWTSDIPTIVVSNLIVVDESMPEALAYSLTSVIFAHQRELAEAHPEWANVQRDLASETGVVPLHPGAQRYFSGG